MKLHPRHSGTYTPVTPATTHPSLRRKPESTARLHERNGNVINAFSHRIPAPYLIQGGNPEGQGESNPGLDNRSRISKTKRYPPLADDNPTTDTVPLPLLPTHPYHVNH